MRFGSTSVILTACCLWTLTLPGCSLRAGGTAQPLASAPPPAQLATAKAETRDDVPISVPQTQVTLPSPQPIQPEALPVAKVEVPPVTSAPQNQTVKRKPVAPKAEPRQQTAVQPQPVSPPQPPTSRRRIRPVESAAERGRLLTEISNRQRQVRDNLAKARNRQLSDPEKAAVERIQAFLDQTETALKDHDLQQAAALSNRALLLSQDLSSEKVR